MSMKKTTWIGAVGSLSLVLLISGPFHQAMANEKSAALQQDLAFRCRLDPQGNATLITHRTPKKRMIEALEVTAHWQPEGFDRGVTLLPVRGHWWVNIEGRLAGAAENFGFNGEGFVRRNPLTKTWVARMPQAIITDNDEVESFKLSIHEETGKGRLLYQEWTPEPSLFRKKLLELEASLLCEKGLLR